MSKVATLTVKLQIKPNTLPVATPVKLWWEQLVTKEAIITIRKRVRL